MLTTSSSTPTTTTTITSNGNNVDFMDVSYGEEKVPPSSPIMFSNKGGAHDHKRFTQQLLLTPQQQLFKKSKQSFINSNTNSPSTYLSPLLQSPETLARRLTSRQKQIDFGKATQGYNVYVNQVPIPLRTRNQPKTPDKNMECSKRCWDGLIAQWRRRLHNWDPMPSQMEE